MASACVADITRPTASALASPAVVMTHGLTATRDLFLDRYAELLAGASIAALLYDHRILGASDGLPPRRPTPGSRYAFIATPSRSNASCSWINEVTLRSVEMFTEYNPGAYIEAGRARTP